MKEEIRHFDTELAVIGSGIAGCAASIFALNRGIKTAQVGNTGAVAYTTGYLDLLGAIEGSAAAVDNPWDGLEQLKKSQPDHPLSRIACSGYDRRFCPVHHLSRRGRHRLHRARKKPISPPLLPPEP